MLIGSSCTYPAVMAENQVELDGAREESNASSNETLHFNNQETYSHLLRSLRRLLRSIESYLQLHFAAEIRTDEQPRIHIALYLPGYHRLNRDEERERSNWVLSSQPMVPDEL